MKKYFEVEFLVEHQSVEYFKRGFYFAPENCDKDTMAKIIKDEGIYAGCIIVERMKETQYT